MSAWLPVAASGFFGIAGALGGQLVTGHRESRSYARARQDKLRDIRAQLYLDMMEYTQDVAARLQVLTSPARQLRTPMTLIHEDHLRARISLYLGDDPVARAWSKLQLMYANVIQSWDDLDEVEIDDETDDRYFRAEARVVQQLDQAIELMKALLFLTLQQEYSHRANQ